MYSSYTLFNVKFSHCLENSCWTNLVIQVLGIEECLACFHLFVCMASQYTYLNIPVGVLKKKSLFRVIQNQRWLPWPLIDLNFIYFLSITTAHLVIKYPKNVSWVLLFRANWNPRWLPWPVICLGIFYFFSMTTCAVTTLVRNIPLGVLKKCCYFSLWIEIQDVHPCICFILWHFLLLQSYCMPNCKTGIGRSPCQFAAVISCYTWCSPLFPYDWLLKILQHILQYSCSGSECF